MTKQEEVEEMDELGLEPIVGPGVTSINSTIEKNYNDMVAHTIGEENDPMKAAEKAAGVVSYTEEEQAAARFLYLLPYIKKFGSEMGNKGVVRVLHALAQFPLQEGKPRLKDKQEEQLFNIFQELTASKSTIIKYALEKQKETKVTGEENVGN